LTKEPETLQNDSIVVSESIGDIGYGVFVKEGCSLNSGEVITEYPGPVEWRTTEQLTRDARGSSRNKYVFSLGPFVVPHHVNSVDVHLVWGRRTVTPATARFVDTLRCAHLVNSSHPLLERPWCSENCVLGIYLNNLRLNQNRPLARMFLVCVRPVVGPTVPIYGPIHELRIDYHWMLALEKGFWCLRTDCERCLENLSDFLVNLGY
jgi:hypothetical protein